LKGNTIRPVVRRLSSEGLIVRRQEGYTIHGSALGRIAIALHDSE